MSQSDLRQLLLKEKPTDAVLSTVDFLILLLPKIVFKNLFPQSAA